MECMFFFCCFVFFSREGLAHGRNSLGYVTMDISQWRSTAEETLNQGPILYSTLYETMIKMSHNSAASYHRNIRTRFRAVVTTVLLNFMSSLMTAELPLAAAMWAQVIPFCNKTGKGVVPYFLRFQTTRSNMHACVIRIISIIMLMRFQSSCRPTCTWGQNFAYAIGTTAANAAYRDRRFTSKSIPVYG